MESIMTFFSYNRQKTACEDAPQLKIRGKARVRYVSFLSNLSYLSFMSMLSIYSILVQLVQLMSNLKKTELSNFNYLWKVRQDLCPTL